MAAAIAITMYIEVPRIAFESQRAREQMAIDRGLQYKRAIQLFYRKYQTFPQTLDDLETTRNIRFLRRRYLDPLTGKDWRLLHVGPAGQLTDSLVQPPAPLPGSSYRQRPEFDRGSSHAFGSSPTASSSQPNSSQPNSGQPADPNNERSQRAGARSLEHGVEEAERPHHRGQRAGSRRQELPAHPGANRWEQPPPGDPDPNQPATAGADSAATIPRPSRCNCRRIRISGSTRPAASRSITASESRPAAASRTARVSTASLAGPATGAASVEFPPLTPGATPGQQHPAPPPYPPTSGFQQTPGHRGRPPVWAGCRATGQPGSRDWRRPGPAKRGQPDPADPDHPTAASVRPPADSPAGSTGGIAGVASTAEGKGIHVINDHNKYKEWEFYYDLKKDKTVVGAGAVNQQQQVQQQMQQNQSE